MLHTTLHAKNNTLIFLFIKIVSNPAQAVQLLILVENNAIAFYIYKPLTVGSYHTEERHSGNKQCTQPVKAYREPARRCQHKEPGLCVQVLVGIKLGNKLLLYTKGSDCVQALQCGTEVGEYWTASCNTPVEVHVFVQLTWKKSRGRNGGYETRFIYKCEIFFFRQQTNVYQT